MGKGYYLPREHGLTAALLAEQSFIGLILNILLINLLSNILSVSGNHKTANEAPSCQALPGEGHSQLSRPREPC